MKNDAIKNFKIKNTNFLNYLKKLANIAVINEKNQSVEDKTEDLEVANMADFIDRQYQSIYCANSKSAFLKYVNGGKLDEHHIKTKNSKKADEIPLIFPFSFNLSQKKCNWKSIGKQLYRNWRTSWNRENSNNS